MARVPPFRHADLEHVDGPESIAASTHAQRFEFEGVEDDRVWSLPRLRKLAVDDMNITWNSRYIENENRFHGKFSKQPGGEIREFLASGLAQYYAW